MKNIKMTIAYDGTRYNGWQRQGNTKNTIQEKLECTLSRIVGENIEIAGAGRTDAGVHAIGQVANAHIDEKLYREGQESIKDKSISEYIMDEMNRYLPKDIRITDAVEEKQRFHARLSAKEKYYSYRIDNGDVARIFDRDYVARIDEKLDIGRMKEAAEYLIGEHDFKSFCANKKMKKSTVRTIYSIDIRKDNGLVVIDYHGNGFLYNMVRIITGTLIEIGNKSREPSDIQRILNQDKRSEAGFLAPASGLFLERVGY